MKLLQSLIGFILVVGDVKNLAAFTVPYLQIPYTSNWNGQQVQVPHQPSFYFYAAASNTLHHSVSASLKRDSSGNGDVCRNPSGQNPDPNYCDKYFDCWEGRPVSSGQCPHGLMFNEKASYCDYPSMVNCNGKKIAQPLDVDEGCEQAYGTFADPHNCTRYTVCHAGRATYYTCDEGLAYDKELGVCTSPQDPSCLQAQPARDPPDESEGLPEFPLDPDNIRPIPPPGPGESEDSGVQFPIIPGVPSAQCSVSADGFVPVTKDCRSVLLCIEGNSYLLNCPQNMYYHPNAASCKTGKSYACGRRNK